MIINKIYHFDTVLATHKYYDHIDGLDDSRLLGRCKDVGIYAEDDAVEAIRTRIPHMFREHKYPGVPNSISHTIRTKPPEATGVTITPIRIIRAKPPILGSRISNMAYLTDLKYLPEEKYAKLENLDVSVIDALRKGEHQPHESLEEALANMSRIQSKKAYLIHMNHRVGLHVVVEKELPPHVHYSYDGLTVTF